MSWIQDIFGGRQVREQAQQQTQGRSVPGVPSSTAETGGKQSGKQTVAGGGSFAEHIIPARDPQTALTVSAVYRAITLRGDTMSVMPVQYRKKDFEGGNFVQDMRGLGKRINYMLQEEANPIMTATDLWNLVELNRTLTGNGFVYIERDEFGFPLHLWLVKECGYNINTATYASIVFLTENGYMTLTNVPAADVMHFPVGTGSLTFDKPAEPDNKNKFWPFGEIKPPKFLHKYGYYEIRCRLPKHDGWHAAFWLQAALRTTQNPLMKSRFGIFTPAMPAFRDK